VLADRHKLLIDVTPAARSPSSGSCRCTCASARVGGNHAERGKPPPFWFAALGDGARVAPIPLLIPCSTGLRPNIAPHENGKYLTMPPGCRGSKWLPSFSVTACSYIRREP